MASWKETAAALFGVRPGEGRPLVLLLLHAVLNGLNICFFYTAASTFFLRHFAAQDLPYVYIFCAIITVLLGMAYTRIEGRLRPAMLLRGLLVLQGGSSLVLWLLVLLGGSRWTSGMLMVWKDVTWVLLNLEFWALAGMLFNLRQGKRLFGILISGELLGGIAGGFITPAVVALTGPAGLLPCAVVCCGLSWPLLAALLPARGAAPTAPAETEEAGAEGSSATSRRSIGELIRDRYLALFFVISILTYLTYYGVDVVYCTEVEARFKNDASVMANFFGAFYAVSGFINLLCSGYVSGRMIARYGLAAGLLTPPLAVLTGATAAVVSYSLLGSSSAFFWVVVALKQLEEVSRATFQTPTYRVLYQPLPAGERLRVQALRESIIEPAATGLSGVLLLVLLALLRLQPIHLLYCVLAILLLWLSRALLLPREYARTLTNALARPRLSPAALALGDASSLAVLMRGVESPHATEVIYCLNTLLDVGHPVLNDLLLKCLDHADPAVRRHVLARIEQSARAALLPAVLARLRREELPAVKGACLRAACALAEADALERVGDYLKDPDPIVHRDVLIGLLRYGSIDSIVAAGTDLAALLRSPDPVRRARGGEIVGEVGYTSFYRPLVDLIGDRDVGVRVAALVAAGKLRNRRLTAVVLGALADPETRPSAAAALAHMGTAALPELAQALTDPARSAAERTWVARICGRIPDPQAHALLADHLGAFDSDLRAQVGESLAAARYTAEPQRRPVLNEQIRAEAETTAWLLAALRDLGADNATALLSGALRHEILKARDRALLRLSFLGSPGQILVARSHLASAAPEPWAYALEIIDTLTPQPLKPLIMPLADELTPEQRLAQLSALFPQPVLGRSERLHEIVASSPARTSSWTCACAIHAAARVAESRLTDWLGAVPAAAPPLVAETVAWSRKAGRGTGEGRTMLLTIEKVIILKSVPIFAEVPDEQLAGVATLLQELEVGPGEVIITKGEFGTSMYVIVEGQVRVHDGDKTLRELGPRQIFGELAALDPEPRSASVTAVEPTRLFRIDRGPLYELMQEQQGVNQGIIRVLCQRIRAHRPA